VTVALDPIATIREDRLLAIVRLEAPADAIAEALASAGVRAVEISLVARDAATTIARWSERFAGLLSIGAGTVVTGEAAERALAAGARYLVSPGFDPEVAGRARGARIPYVPGTMTPTEVQHALADGAELVKLFPAAALGPGYVRDLLGPFPQASFLATGGIDETNARAFLDAGAVAVAAGGSLVREGRSPAEVAQAATSLRNATRP
jgi:2-dehydro-3-deoxyphosphogluconate aldolase / (4S)-4-hydroxy-2-oxoglutarate aldolase